MPLHVVHCPHCGQKHQYRTDSGGTIRKCERCGRKFELPEAYHAAVTEAPEPEPYHAPALSSASRCPKCHADSVRWLYACLDGTRDMRYKDNPRVCAACGWRSDRVEVSPAMLAGCLVTVLFLGCLGIMSSLGGRSEQTQARRQPQPRQEWVDPDDAPRRPSGDPFAPRYRPVTDRPPLATTRTLTDEEREEMERAEAAAKAAMEEEQRAKAEAERKAIDEERKRKEAAAKLAREAAELQAAAEKQLKDEEKAAALLKLGKSFQADGQVEIAVGRYRKVIEQYPSTKAAEEAKGLLKKLGK